MNMQSLGLIVNEYDLKRVNNKRNLENLDFSNIEESEDEYSVYETDQSEDENHSKKNNS